MKNGTTPPSNTILKQDKYNQKFDSQLFRVYNAFFEQPGTMKEVDLRIGIMRESICWFCRKLRKQDKLYPIRKRLCNVTNHLAIEWTTNSSLVPPSPAQLDLFEPIKQEQVQEPIDFELSLRIEGDLYEQHLVQEITHFAGSLRIVPQNHKKALETGWENLFQGTLIDCDAFVSTLLNVKP